MTNSGWNFLHLILESPNWIRLERLNSI